MKGKCAPALKEAVFAHSSGLQPFPNSFLSRISEQHGEKKDMYDILKEGIEVLGLNTEDTGRY